MLVRSLLSRIDGFDTECSLMLGSSDVSGGLRLGLQLEWEAGAALAADTPTPMDPFHGVQLLPSDSLGQFSGKALKAPCCIHPNWCVEPPDPKECDPGPGGFTKVRNKLRIMLPSCVVSLFKSAWLTIDCSLLAAHCLLLTLRT